MSKDNLFSIIVIMSFTDEKLSDSNQYSVEEQNENGMQQDFKSTLQY